MYDWNNPDSGAGSCFTDRRRDNTVYMRIFNIPSDKKPASSLGCTSYEARAGGLNPSLLTHHNLLINKGLTAKTKQTAAGPEQLAYKAYSQSLSSVYPSYSPNLLLLTPAIFGGVGAFLLGFGFHGRSLTVGYSKYIFFIDILALIASLGVGAFIYEARQGKTTLSDIIIPALLLIFFFAAVSNLTYSLYPDTFSGVIGKTPITQFLSFLAISVGAISVGETLNVAPEKPEVQILIAMEALFSLFVLSLIIAVVAL